jgi:hypothetical protein
MAKGGPATPKRPKKKKKGFGFGGWPDHPLGLWVWFGHPKKKKKVLAFEGGQTTPLGHGGGSAIPKFSLLFYFLNF